LLSSRHDPYRFWHKEDHIPQALSHTFKNSLQICESARVRAARLDFGPHPTGMA